MPKKLKKQPEIEVLTSNEQSDGDEWFIKQEIPEISVLNGFKYGFANQKCATLKNTEVIYLLFANFQLRLYFSNVLARVLFRFRHKKRRYDEFKR